MFEHGSIWEFFQLFIALTGLGFAMWSVWVAFDDAVEFTNAPPSDLRRLVALSRMRGQFARVVAQGVLVFIGVVSVLLPPPDNLPHLAAEIEQSLLVRLGLVLVTIILTLDGIMERQQRISFMNTLEHSGEERLSAQMTAQSVVDAETVKELKEAIQKGTDAAKNAYEQTHTVNTKIAELTEKVNGVKKP